MWRSSPPFKTGTRSYHSYIGRTPSRGAKDLIAIICSLHPANDQQLSHTQKRNKVLHENPPTPCGLSCVCVRFNHMIVICKCTKYFSLRATIYIRCKKYASKLLSVAPQQVFIFKLLVLKERKALLWICHFKLYPNLCFLQQVLSYGELIFRDFKLGFGKIS